jgi:hypothetical protein
MLGSVSTFRIPTLESAVPIIIKGKSKATVCILTGKTNYFARWLPLFGSKVQKRMLESNPMLQTSLNFSIQMTLEIGLSCAPNVAMFEVLVRSMARIYPVASPIKTRLFEPKSQVRTGCSK